MAYWAGGGGDDQEYQEDYGGEGEMYGEEEDYGAEEEEDQDQPTSVFGGGPPPRGPPPRSSTSPPSVWQEKFDEDSQMPYWYNRVTGESTWEKPTEFGGDGGDSGLSSSFGGMRVDDSQSASQQAEVPDLPQYSSSDFQNWDIMKYCNEKLKPVRKTMFTKPRTVTEQMRWSKELKHPLQHGTLSDKSFHAIALKMFRDITYYCGDRKGKFGPGDLRYCQAAISKALKSPELADEFFLQLIKQTRNNPNSGDEASAGITSDPQKSRKKDYGESSMIYLYHLFPLAAGCLTPTDGLWKYLDVFLARSESPLSGIPKESQKLARFAREQMDRSQKIGTFRIFPPNRREYQAVLRRQPVFLRVNLLDGTHITTKVYCQSTVADIVAQISSKMALELPYFDEQPCFGLFQQAFDKSKFISENSLQEKVRMNDVLAVQDENTGSSDGMRFDVVFKAKLFLSHMFDGLDGNAINLYYIQAVHDIRTDLMPLDEDDSHEIAALRCHIMFPNSDPTMAELSEVMNDWYPSKLRIKIRNTKKRDLAFRERGNTVLGIRAQKGYTLAALGDSEAGKREFLRFLNEKVSMFGCTTFLCRHIGDVVHDDWDYDKNCLKKLTKSELAVMKLQFEKDYGVLKPDGTLQAPAFRRNKARKQYLLVGVNEKGIAWFDRRNRNLIRYDKLHWIHTQGASDFHFVYVVTNTMYGDKEKRAQVFSTKHAGKLLDLVRTYKRVPGFEVNLDDQEIPESQQDQDYGQQPEVNLDHSYGGGYGNYGNAAGIGGDYPGEASYEDDWKHDGDDVDDGGGGTYDEEVDYGGGHYDDDYGGGGYADDQYDYDE